MVNNIIEINNLCKSYGDVKAVSDLSFCVKEGELFAFLGINGAGKSTTINIMCGQLAKDSGQVTINGSDLDRELNSIKRSLGVVFQNSVLDKDLTVRDNLESRAALYGIYGRQFKERLHELASVLEFENLLNRTLGKLSGGQRRRIDIARALINRPRILILDEPTVGLDPKQITEIRNLIKELGKTHTVILSSHILSEVSQICNKVIIINKGKIVAIDTPENLEAKVSNKNCLYVTVEDPEDKMNIIKNKIKEIKKIELVEKNEDGTKQYMIESEDNADLRKMIFSELAKEDITIFEMKKADTTLEDAFMKLIEGGNK